MNEFDRVRLAIWQDQLFTLDDHYKGRAAHAKGDEALAQLREEYKREVGPLKWQIARCVERSAIKPSE